ncbi:MAG: hypothetical protein AAGA93_09830 [Actinomycetota bacterium]
MTSVAPSPPANGRPDRRRARLAGPVAAFCALALLATACGGGPGTQEEFNEILMRGDNLTADEADCISTAVFDEYGEDQDALGKLSAAPDIEFLDGPDGIPGFTEFFDSAVDGCLQVGPSN